MPIHLIWGDDSAGKENYINTLIKTTVDPSWISINLSRLEGTNPEQAIQALEEARTPPLGSGCKIIWLNNSPFCNGCTNELAILFEETLKLISVQNHLLLSNHKKPDGRLKPTKALQKLIKSKCCIEKSFVLPAAWDKQGQQELIKRIAKEIGLQMESDVIEELIDAIGNDSVRIYSELQKLSLNAETTRNSAITTKMVRSLIEGISTNAIEIANSLLINKPIETIALLDALLEKGEPPLKILATLIGQVRGWLWVSLLEKAGEKDVGFIAKASGINNPKRIYVIRKQLNGQPPELFLTLLSRLLSIEAAIKMGIEPKDAFRDGLLSTI